MGWLKKLNEYFYTGMSVKKFDKKLNKIYEASQIVLADLKGDLLTMHAVSGNISKYKIRDGRWYKYPMMEPIDIDLKMFQIITYIEEHGNPYPTAHLNKHII